MSGYCPPQNLYDTLFNPTNFIYNCEKGGGGGGSVGPAGATGATGPAGPAGPPLIATYTLTDAEILSLTPVSGIEIIPAPGAGKAIFLQYIIASSNLIVPFNGGDSYIGLRTPPAPYLQGPIIIYNGSLDNQFSIAALSVGGSLSIFENQPINIYSYDYTVLSDGTGSTLKFEVCYTLYDL